MTTREEFNALLDDKAIPEEMRDNRWIDARTLLIDPSDPDSESDATDALRALVATLEGDPFQRHDFSELLLDFSLCPMHRIDYAICFDDDDDECATIRAYFPDHDT